MKEQTLVDMKNKVEAMTRVLQQFINEQQFITTLASGTLEAVKLLPGYADAIKQLTEKAKAPVEEPKLEI